MRRLKTANEKLIEQKGKKDSPACKKLNTQINHDFLPECSMG